MDRVDATPTMLAKELPYRVANLAPLAPPVDQADPAEHGQVLGHRLARG